MTDSRQRSDDAPDVGPEAHIHHAIGFVEHEQFDPPEVRVLLAHVIDQPARRGDDDVDACPQGALLHAHVDAAVNCGARNRRVVREAVNLVLDLHGELARRREHEDAGRWGPEGLRHFLCVAALRRFHCGAGLRRFQHVTGLRPFLWSAGFQPRFRGEQPLKHRHDERGRFAGAGLRAGDEVVARERERNHRGLDWARLRESEIPDTFEQPRVQVERRKRNRRGVTGCRLESRSLRRGMARRP